MEDQCICSGKNKLKHTGKAVQSQTDEEVNLFPHLGVWRRTEGALAWLKARMEQEK